MRIINVDGLPQPVYEWILASQKEYSKGSADVSVTELINPPRIRVLKKKLYDQIVIEASSLLNVTVGQAIHKSIQDATKTGVSERRLDCEIFGWKVSGGMDHWVDGILSDWKTANKWKTVLSDTGNIEEWEKQLNCYAHILRSHDIPVSKTKIWAYFKDWNRGEHSRYSKQGGIFDPGYKAGYPDNEWLYFDLRLWSPEESKSYMEERVKLHQDADKALPLCPKEELWNGKRCSDYCIVSFGCSQYQSTLKENK